jgi:NAD(P)H-flavin reductase
VVAGAGQFFMIKPARTPVFLGRPVSVFSASPLTFVIARKGKGTEAVCAMRPGEEAELTGPLGNRFADFLPVTPSAPALPARIALAGGGIGTAPLSAFAAELRGANRPYHFFAGFKTKAAVIPHDETRDNFTVITEDGSEGAKGVVTDFLNPAEYTAVFACGPLPMLYAVSRSCAARGVPCFVSMEKRMACGVGACLGCTITTGTGNKRCCKDGPVFDAGTVLW